MSLADELLKEVSDIILPGWDEQTTVNVPAPEDLRLNRNHAKNLESATVLYADLDGSTAMVQKYSWWFSAEVYKAYLRCASLVIRSEGGVITAYDGDRVMAIFTGNSKNTSAVRAALKINWAVQNLIRIYIKSAYPTVDFLLNHVVGIDTSQLRAARIGVRGDNDIVWIGRAANYAAKLTSLSEPSNPTWITKAVYDQINDEVKFANGVSIWQARSWTPMNNELIYCSGWNLSIP